MAPKKGKKGGKKGKKGKSGKKKAKEESVEKQAAANSMIWEARLRAIETTKNDFRENAQQLATENDLLQNQMQQTELDTIDVITFLKKQDQKKDETVEKFEAELKNCKRLHRQEKQTLVDDFNDQIHTLEKQMTKKQDDIALMQNELKHVKEFRKKRAHMQRELDEIKDSMFLANREHKEETSRMEQKFLEEKISLQKEANQKISELADRAHQEAIANLDETTRSVYKENVRLSEALKFHIKEGESLKQQNQKLQEENTLLNAERENSDAVIQERISDSRKQKAKIKELTAKVDTLERAINHMVREFDVDRKQLVEKAGIENESSRNEITKLQRICELKTKEGARIKKLARNILSQRTDIERFFLESLDIVKKEIAMNQIEYKKAAEQAYNQRMLAAFSGKGEYPKVRTFNKSDTSTNNVFRDLEAAEMLAQTSGEIDISELTWEQREKVLRYLFARMNGAQSTVAARSNQQMEKANMQQLSITHDGGLAGNVEADPFYDKDDSMFLTQVAFDGNSSPGLNKHSIIPDIGQQQLVS